jgi:hypothetical protein
MALHYSAVRTVSRGFWFCLAPREVKRCFLQHRVMQSLRAKQPPRENTSYEAMPWRWARQSRPVAWLSEAKQLPLASTPLQVKRLPLGWPSPSRRRLHRLSSCR